MAQLLQGPRGNPLAIETGMNLAEKLPDDFVIVANASLNTEHPPIKFDLAIVKPTAVFVADIEQRRLPRRPNQSMQYSGPISRLRNKARAFSTRLRSPDIASQVFDDPRVAASLWILPMLLATETRETSIPRRVPSDFRPAILDLEQAVQYIKNPEVRGRYCNLYPQEMEHLGQLLIGVDERRRQTQETIEKARSLLASGEYQEADALLRDIQAAAPYDLQDEVRMLSAQIQDVQLLMAVADEKIQNGDFQEAEEYLEKAATVMPQSTSLNYQLASTQGVSDLVLRAGESLQIGDFSNAIDYYEKSRSMMRDNRYLQYQLATAQGVYELVERADESFWNGNFEAATQHLEKTISMMPDNAYLRKRLQHAKEAWYLTSKAWARIAESVDALAKNDIGTGLEELSQAKQIAPYDSPDVLDLQEAFERRQEADRLSNRAVQDLGHMNIVGALGALQRARKIELELLQLVPEKVMSLYQRTSDQFLPDREDRLANLTRFEHDTQERISRIDRSLEKTLIGAARTLDERLVESVEGTATVYFRDHTLETPLRVDESYELVVQVTRAESIPDDPFSSIASKIGLPPLGTEVELTVTLYAETSRIDPTWSQQLRMLPDERTASVEFILTPERPGIFELRVEFFFGNRWLQKMTKELVVEDVSTSKE
jgi:tetratricopeptide (TPR) repeat protein